MESKVNMLEAKGSKEHLVYVSLGTVFNNNFSIYKTIVDAFKTFDANSSQSQIRLDNLSVIVSTGEKVYDQFKALMESNQYVLPRNIELVKTAPQIEILKRASLFVSHCGMNSTSETVHYGGKWFLIIYRKFCFTL